MTRRVALLRGLNVGGRHRVAMADLRDLFTDAGAEHVRTVIQSGNVCFDHPDRDATVLARLEPAFAERFGFSSPITLRTRPELDAALDAHPWTPGAVEPKLHHVIFLAGPAPDDAVERLADVVGDDDLAVIGRELHARYPNGSARSKLTVDAIDRALQTTATARNLPTCHKIVEALGD